MLIKACAQLGAIFCFGDGKAFSLETPAQQRPNLCIVVNDKDMHVGHGSALECDIGLLARTYCVRACFW